MNENRLLDILGLDKEDIVKLFGKLEKEGVIDKNDFEAKLVDRLVKQCDSTIHIAKKRAEINNDYAYRLIEVNKEFKTDNDISKYLEKCKSTCYEYFDSISKVSALARYLNEGGSLDDFKNS